MILTYEAYLSLSLIIVELLLYVLAPVSTLVISYTDYLENFAKYTNRLKTQNENKKLTIPSNEKKSLLAPKILIVIAELSIGRWVIISNKSFFLSFFSHLTTHY